MGKMELTGDCDNKRWTLTTALQSCVPSSPRVRANGDLMAADITIMRTMQERLVRSSNLVKSTLMQVH